MLCQGLPVHTLNNISLSCKAQRGQDSVRYQQSSPAGASQACCFVPAKVGLAPAASDIAELMSGGQTWVQATPEEQLRVACFPLRPLSGLPHDVPLHLPAWDVGLWPVLEQEVADRALQKSTGPGRDHSSRLVSTAEALSSRPTLQRLTSKVKSG